MNLDNVTGSMHNGSEHAFNSLINCHNAVIDLAIMSAIALMVGKPIVIDACLAMLPKHFHTGKDWNGKKCISGKENEALYHTNGAIDNHAQSAQNECKVAVNHNLQVQLLDAEEHQLAFKQD